MSEPFGPYRVILTLAARNQSRIDLVENTLVQTSDGSNRREILKRILIVPGKEDNRELIEAEEQGSELQKQAHNRNPHIIEVYGSGRLNEYFYVSMEYVEGENLEEYLKASALSPGSLNPVKAASIACELCSQVATLHEFLLTLEGKSQAYLHNDIKPSNIQIRKSDNQIRLIDFGAAKSVTYSKNFTRNDFASVAYCSPERLQKGLSDTQTDLWSIAVVLYEMVAGALPFRASSHQQLELLITSGALPAALPESCPANLQAVIYKALSTNVENRYPDARAFADDLQKFCVAPDAPTVKTALKTTENPTRKVNFHPSAPALQQPATQTVLIAVQQHTGLGCGRTRPAAQWASAPGRCDWCSLHTQTVLLRAPRGPWNLRALSDAVGRQRAPPRADSLLFAGECGFPVDAAGRHRFAVQGIAKPARDELREILCLHQRFAHFDQTAPGGNRRASHQRISNRSVPPAATERLAPRPLVP